MSRERELLERAYYVLGELSYAMLKDSGEYNLAGDIYEYLASVKPEQPEPFAYYDMQEDRFEFAKPTTFEGIPKSISIPKLPLYLHSEKKQEVVRVTTEQRLEAYKELEKEIGDQANLRSFLEGICFAEKQLTNMQNTLNHQTSASTDALMQSHCRGDKC